MAECRLRTSSAKSKCGARYHHQIPIILDFIYRQNFYCILAGIGVNPFGKETTYILSCMRPSIIISAVSYGLQTGVGGIGIELRRSGRDRGIPCQN